METMKVKALKLHPDFFCVKTGVCDNMYICINPTGLLNPVCSHLLVKSSNRKIHEEIEAINP